MNSAPSTIRLNKSHVKRASKVCAYAFHDYPQSKGLIPDGRLRRRLLPHIFECCLNYGILYGEVYAVSPALEGIAVWLPSEMAELSLPKMMKAGFLKMSGRIGPAVLYRVVRSLLYSTTVLGKHAGDADWMLFQLAVNPACQGKGYASVLLKSMLAKLDKEKLSCCLDTHDEKNVNVYRRFGFKVVHTAPVPQSGTNMWAMVRRLPA